MANGGLASEIVGGKFANGAVTSAMAYAFNQAQDSRSSDKRIDRKVGTAENFVEITDDNTLMIFEELGLGEHVISALSEIQPFDQLTIDLAIEGLAAAVVGDAVLDELVDTVVSSATLPLRTRNPRFILNQATLDNSFDPIRLQNAIDSRLHGIGQGARTAAAARIRRGVDCRIQGC